MIHLVNQSATPDEIHETATHLANTRGELDSLGLLMSQQERVMLDQIEHRLQQALKDQVALNRPSDHLHNLLESIRRAG
jgi:hypothetical protein